MVIERILWRRLDLPGHEIATLEEIASGWQLSGTALFVYEQLPCRMDYLVSCDIAWRTTAAHVVGVVGETRIDLRVSVDAERRWQANGVACAVVEGCLDIDLGFSPSTNLLPIRRLALTVGEKAGVTAAWLPFPSLEFERLPQVYRREGDLTYRYESGGGAFVRALDVDAAGFVTSYPGLWQAESARA